MNQLVTSKEKIEEFKSRFAYFNHFQEKGNMADMNWNLILPELRLLIDTPSSYEVVSYYNSFALYFLGKTSRNELDMTIISTLQKLNNKQSESIKKKIIDDEKLIIRMLKRSKASYGIDLNRDTKDKVSQSLLHMYGSAYENTEMLFVLFWICQSLTNKSLKTDFDSYKDSYGNYKKGRLITDIIKMLEDPELNDFKKVIKVAYYKDLRHLAFHNNVVLDDEKKVITEIDNLNSKIKYTDAFKSFYALQQLHNYLRMVISNINIEDNAVENEGIVTAVSGFIGEEEEEILCLIQLAPFYDLDEINETRLKKLSVYFKDNIYIIKSNEDKEVLRITSDKTIDNWYKNSNKKKIMILCAIPNVFVEENSLFTINHNQIGSFLIVDEYMLEDVTLN